jgi:hypothetical protein
MENEKEREGEKRKEEKSKLGFAVIPAQPTRPTDLGGLPRGPKGQRKQVQECEEKKLPLSAFEAKKNMRSLTASYGSSAVA